MKEDGGKAFRARDRGRNEAPGRALRIPEMKKIIGRLPEVRTGRVRAIEEMIALGTYKVDAGKIADRMIEEQFWLGPETNGVSLTDN